MSLLDDVSIVVTPNGYKAGELYAVIPVPTVGTEEVVNGDFATDSDWTKGTGWTISSGLLSCDGTQTGVSQVYQFGVITLGTRYQITFTVSNYSSGTIRAGADGSWGSYYSANGTYTYDITSAGTLFIIQANSTFVGSIDNVSVKEYTSADMDVTRNTAATRVDENGLVNYAEVIGGDIVTNGDFATDSAWTKGTSWSISGGTANFDDTATSGLSQNMTFVSGKTYRISFEVISGTASIGFYSSNGVTSYIGYQVYSIGTHNVNFLHSTGANLGIFGNKFASSAFSIDNVSVKEVTRDNVPRIDYTGGGCPHILAEPQSTNLFINSVWDGGTDNVSAPTGWSLNDISDPVYSYSTSQYTSGKKINIQCTVSRLIMSQTVTIPSNSLVNVSVKIKYISGSTPLSNIASSLNAPADFIRTYYYNNVLVSAGFTPTEDGILEMKTSSVTGGVSGIRLGLGTGGSSTGHIELDMPQCETLTYRTSFIPTTTSTVTRNQDLFSRDGIGSLINSTEGVLFAEMAALSNDGTFRQLTLSDGTTANRILVDFTDASNQIRVFCGSGGVSQVSETFNVTSSLSFNKIAFKYKLNDFALWVNGVEVVTDTSGITPIGLNKLSFHNGAGSFDFFGKVKQLQVYNTALTDEQLLQLTGESGTDFYESYAEMASALTYTIQ